MCAHIVPDQVRSSVIESSGQRLCADGDTERGAILAEVVFRHALPNALLPAINVVALTIAWLLGRRRGNRE